MIEMGFQVLVSENDEIQKSHYELRKRKEEIDKAQENLHISMHRVYQKVIMEYLILLIEDKVWKVNETIS
jgi:hypothetical protein